ncbi:gp26 [Burkholderia phage Bcep176]|nr:gp26 [Burkholderia phage Bcep176]ABA60027.1 gp26 [Burkholderia phage Bcep176]
MAWLSLSRFARLTSSSSLSPQAASMLPKMIAAAIA